MIYLINTQKKEIVKYLTDLGYVELETIRQPYSITTATKYHHISSGNVIYLNAYTHQSQSIFWTTNELKEWIYDKSDKQQKRKDIVTSLTEYLEDYSYNLDF